MLTCPSLLPQEDGHGPTRTMKTIELDQVEDLGSDDLEILDDDFEMHSEPPKTNGSPRSGIAPAASPCRSSRHAAGMTRETTMMSKRRKMTLLSVEAGQ